MESKVDIEDIETTSVSSGMIIIHSQPLLETLRAVITFYPFQNLTGDAVKIVEPYAVLVHHFSELVNLKVQHLTPSLGLLANATNATEAFACSEIAYSHLQLLLSSVKATMTEVVGPAEKKLSRPVPVVTFDTLWYLFKPGVDIYSELSYEDQYEASIVSGSKMQALDQEEMRKHQRAGWEVNMIDIESNGVKIGRTMSSTIIEWFEGEREVTSLSLYPSEYWDRKDGGKRRKAFEERGEKLFRLLQAGPKQMQYDGFPYSRRKTLVRHH